MRSSSCLLQTITKKMLTLSNVGYILQKELNSGFLQVRDNWKMSGNLCCPGNVWEKYYFLKVRKNDLGSCRLQITVIFCISKY